MREPTSEDGYLRNLWYSGDMDTTPVKVQSLPRKGFLEHGNKCSWTYETKHLSCTSNVYEKSGNALVCAVPTVKHGGGSFMP